MRSARSLLACLCLAWWFAFYQTSLTTTTQTPTVMSGYRWWVECEDSRARLLRRASSYFGIAVVYFVDECVEGDGPTIVNVPPR